MQMEIIQNLPGEQYNSVRFYKDVTRTDYLEITQIAPGNLLLRSTTNGQMPITITPGGGVNTINVRF